MPPVNDELKMPPNTPNNSDGLPKSTDNDSLQKVASSLEAVTGAIASLQQQQQQQAQLLQQITHNLQNPPTPSKDDDDGDYDVDLESMSRTDFANKLLSVIDKRMDKSIQGLQKKLEEFDTRVGTVDAKAEVSRLRRDNPDFDNFKDEMVSLARENPGLSVERLYRLAKAENPEKVKKLEEEAAAKKAAEKPPEDEGKKFFSGMLPGGSFTPPPSNGRMDPKSAADKAWEQVIKPYGDLEALLSSESDAGGP